ILKRSYAKAQDDMIVGAQYAQFLMKLNEPAWLESDEETINAKYTLLLTDDYGFTNDDAGHAYDLSVIKDKPPFITLAGLPNRSPSDEPHVLEPQLRGFAAVVKGSDDCGIAKIVLHYRIEDLDNNQELAKDTITRVLPVPQPDIPQLNLLKL